MSPSTTAMLALSHLRVAARIQERRVRIQRQQHAVDGTVDDAVRLDLAGVLAFDGRERRREGAVVAVDLIFSRLRAGPEEPPGECRHQNREY
jgi:hypothetical protein